MRKLFCVLDESFYFEPQIKLDIKMEFEIPLGLKMGINLEPVEWTFLLMLWLKWYSLVEAEAGSV